MNPKVSVIVPNYNHARYLNQRIDSILNQSYQDFELILLDDCSTDNSRGILLSYEKNPHVSHIVFNEKNAGTAFKQWNKGVALAKGEYIWIAESDDWAKEDFLEVVVGELEKHRECGIAYTLAHYMQDGVEQWSLNATGEIKCWDGKEYIRKMLAYGCRIYNVSMTVFRRDLFAKVNQQLYSEMHLCGDWFFYTQLCEQSGVIQIDSPHSFYRMHKSNVHNRAEHEGLTFLEGIKVLEYMEQRCSLRLDGIARYWGRTWVNYLRKYQIENETNRKIILYMKQNHMLIYVWYLFYRFKKGVV